MFIDGMFYNHWMSFYRESMSIEGVSFIVCIKYVIWGCFDHVWGSVYGVAINFIINGCFYQTMVINYVCNV